LDSLKEKLRDLRFWLQLFRLRRVLSPYKLPTRALLLAILPIAAATKRLFRRLDWRCAAVEIIVTVPG
jgi:hypothetical protein